MTQLILPVLTVSVDLVEGGPLVREVGDATISVLESINLPPLALPIIHSDQALVDGGLLNNIPANVLVAIQENLRAFMSRLQSGFCRQGLGKLVGFISGKGGCGSTTLACHTAVEVARRAVEQRKRALLMDFDLNAGLTRFMLKSENAYSVCDAINNLAKLDIDYWRRFVGSAIPDWMF
jgi:Flp pilus assembly CpaE family ATPase